MTPQKEDKTPAGRPRIKSGDGRAGVHVRTDSTIKPAGDQYGIFTRAAPESA